jgi:hypothetical protein
VPPALSSWWTARRLCPPNPCCWSRLARRGSARSLATAHRLAGQQAGDFWRLLSGLRASLTRPCVFGQLPLIDLLLGGVAGSRNNSVRGGGIYRFGCRRLKFRRGFSEGGEWHVCHCGLRWMGKHTRCPTQYKLGPNFGHGWVGPHKSVQMGRSAWGRSQHSCPVVQFKRCRTVCVGPLEMPDRWFVLSFLLPTISYSTFPRYGYTLKTSISI